MQAPIKERYKSDAGAALITLKPKGTLHDQNIACKVDTGRALAVAGLHPATGGGAWAVVDFVGSGATVNLAVSSLIKGGTVVVVGLYGGDITLSLPPFPMRAITIQGSYVGSLPEMRELIELVRRTGLPRVPVATRPLDDVNAVMNELRAGKVVGRVVLNPA